MAQAAIKTPLLTMIRKNISNMIQIFDALITCWRGVLFCSGWCFFTLLEHQREHISCPHLLLAALTGRAGNGKTAEPLVPDMLL